MDLEHIFNLPLCLLGKQSNSCNTGDNINSIVRITKIKAGSHLLYDTNKTFVDGEYVSVVGSVCKL